MDSRSSDHPVATGADIVRLQQDWGPLRGAAPLAQVESYWYALRGARLVPSRSEVDPRGIEGALSHAFILERIAPGHARIRIAGTHLTDLLGMEVRGMPLSALFEPVARGQVQAAVRCLFDDPAIQKFTLSSAARLGKPALRAQMALYPLLNDSGEVARALGCLVSEGTIGRGPRRFEVERVDRKMLQDEALRLGPRPDPAEVDLVPARDFASDPSRDPALDPQATGAFATPAPGRVAAAAEPVTEFRTTSVPWLRVVTSREV